MCIEIASPADLEQWSVNSDASVGLGSAPVEDTTRRSRASSERADTVLLRGVEVARLGVDWRRRAGSLRSTLSLPSYVEIASPADLEQWSVNPCAPIGLGSAPAENTPVVRVPRASGLTPCFRGVLR